jgi:hypothetical protein
VQLHSEQFLRSVIAHVWTFVVHEETDTTLQVLGQQVRSGLYFTPFGTEPVPPNLQLFPKVVDLLFRTEDQALF